MKVNNNTDAAGRLDADGKIKYAIYARTASSDKITVELTQERIKCQSISLQEKNQNLVGVYFDQGVSGAEYRRPELQRLLDDCRLGKVDFIVTKSFSCLARDMAVFWKIVKELRSLNVDLYFEQEDIRMQSEDGKSIFVLLESFEGRG